MTNLKCNVYSCTHHKNDHCCKPNIKVEGVGAMSANETECASFAPKGAQNTVGTTTPNPQLEIVCSAKECMYNNASRCRANNVSINTLGGNAACATFTKKN